MKTKYILAALCLPALFTACSNEEFAVENEIGDKPVVKLKLSTTYGTEGMVDTRMVNNNGTFLWDNTDMLGACLLSGDDDNIYSNNQFTNTLTEASAKADFTTASTTVVGKYLFYYNYNPAMTTDVTGVQYSLKEPQEYDPDGTKMMENNFMISPRITVDGKEPGGLTLPLTMRSIYGYGLLNLKLDNAYDASSVNIQKIIISYTSNVHNPGIIDMSAVPSADLSAANLRTLREGSTPDYTGKTDAELTNILLKEADELLTAYNTTYTSGTILDLTAAKSASETAKQISITCISAENPNGIALSKTGEFSTRMLLPTTTNGGENVRIDVYTDKGKYSVTKNASRIKAGHTVNLADINRTGSETALTMNSFTVGNEVNAISEADFIASMAQFNGKSQTVEVTVGNFEITPKAIAAVPSDVTLSFQNSATFNGDMILKNMTFAADGTYTMKAGNITLDQAVTFTNGAKVEITGAKVAVGATKNDYAKYTVAGGELNINNVDLNGDPASTTINSIVVTEGGTVNVETPITVTTFTLTKGTVNNNGTISTIAIEKDGTLVNKGTVTEISANAGVVDNYKTLTAVTKNDKTINQKDAKAVITSCTTNSAAGIINTASYSQTTVETNNGEIVYTENARIKVTSDSGNGNVTYQAPATIKATDFSALSAAITKIKFNSDFTYDGAGAQATLPTGVKTLEFSGNLTLSKDWTLNENSTISFVGATANITGQSKIIAATTLKMNVGVAAVPTVSEAVLTDMYIAPGITITTAQDGLTVVIESGAKVWNDGTVNGNASSSPTGWSGNAITNNN